MTFDDPFLLDDADALTETCLLEVPSAGHSSADTWGLGSEAHTTSRPLPCMEVPTKLFINRDTGLETSLPLGLCIQDDDGLVTESSRLVYQGTRYAVKELLTSPHHALKRVVLLEVS